MKVGYEITTGRKIPKVPKDGSNIRWRNFIKLSRDHELIRVHKDKDETVTKILEMLDLER